MLVVYSGYSWTIAMSPNWSIPNGDGRFARESPASTLGGTRPGKRLHNYGQIHHAISG